MYKQHLTAIFTAILVAALALPGFALAATVGSNPLNQAVFQTSGDSTGSEESDGEGSGEGGTTPEPTEETIEEDPDC